jgi:hypothetical protein
MKHLSVGKDIGRCKVRREGLLTNVGYFSADYVQLDAQ